MKHILLFSLILFTKAATAQYIDCPKEPCTLYVPWSTCCTGELRVRSGNQCIIGPALIENTTFTNFNFLSFFNVRVNSLVDLRGGPKKVYLRDASLDSLMMDGDDTVICLGGIPIIRKIINVGPGNNAVIIASGLPVANLEFVNYGPNTSHENEYGPTAQTWVRICGIQLLALRPPTGSQLRPDVVYPFVLTELSTGRKKSFTGTYQQMKSSLPLMVPYAYTVRMSYPEKIMRVN